MYNLIYLVLLAILANLLPSRFPVLSMMVLYVAFMAYKGVDYLGLKQNKTSVFVAAVSVMFLLIPAVLRSILEIIIT